MIAAFFLLAGVGKLVDMPTLEVQVGAHIPCCRADRSEGPARGRPCRVAAGETTPAQNGSIRATSGVHDVSTRLSVLAKPLYLLALQHGRRGGLRVH